MRPFHTQSALRAIRPAFAPHNPGKGKGTFELLFVTGGNQKKPEKVWDKKGISKDEFFVRKYAHIGPDHRRRLDEKVALQRRLRQERRNHEAEKLPEPPRRRSPVVLNPLCEYVYGTHPVLSALKAAKRPAFSTLYIHNAKEHTKQILDAAKRFGVRVVEKKTKGEMNTLSSNGVHNGVVLETQPLVIPQLLAVGAADAEGRYALKVVDDATNKAVPVPQVVARQQRPNRNAFPFGVFVDGVTDPQNIGSIVRSAYYLGADFLLIPESESARLGPVAAKAAAGALDVMPIYKIESPLHFVDAAKKQGWNVVVTSSQIAHSEDTKDKHRQHLANRFIDTDELPRIMDLAPMLMVLGSEGDGVRTNMKLRADFLVGMSKGRADNTLVDSLNVGVAAGMLIGKCLD